MKVSLNLMTDEDRRMQLLGESKRFWTRILSTTLLVLVMVGAAEWWQSGATSAQLKSLEVRYAPVQALKNDCIRMRTDINGMRDAQQLTLRLVDTRPTVTLLAALSSAAAETSGRVFVEELVLQQTDNSSTQRTAVVQGVGQDNSSIARFAAALRDSELFADVNLSSSDTSPLNDGVARSFRIECQL